MKNKDLTPNRILVIKLRLIGDAVIATPVLKALRKKYPGSHISMMVRSKTADILLNNPNVDNIIPVDIKKLYNPFLYFKLIMDLRKEKFDLIVNLHASFKSALIAFLAGRKYRVVHNHSGTNYFSNIKVDAEETPKSVIERDFDAIRLLGIDDYDNHTEVFLNNEEISWADGYLKKNHLDKEGFILGIGIGSNRPAKCWPLEYYADLFDRLGSFLRKNDKSGVHKVNVVIFADYNTLGKAKQIEGFVKSKKPFIASNLSLRQLVALIGKVGLFIGNDSGPGHIAIALKKPSIIFIGPERPCEWHPYDENEGHICLYKDVDCRLDGFCGKYECDDMKCLKSISVDEVLEAIAKLNKYLI